MKRVAVLAAALFLLDASIALAWDPYWPDLDAGFPDPDPAPYVAPDPAPYVAPDPAPDAPSGLYLVTDVYAGDVVTSAGSTTTYTTSTVSDQPGTYARPVDTVGTGVPSAYDGLSFNGRARLPDGRLVAGTYYEDYVLTSTGYVLVNIVFFQDDSLTADVPPPPSTPAPTAAPPAGPGATPAPPSTPAPAPAPTPAPPAVPPSPPSPDPITGTAGVALAPDAPPVTSIDVLRGRVVLLWPRAFSGGVSVPVRSWRLVSASDIATRAAGDGATPCDAMWLVPSFGTPSSVRFEVTSDALPGLVLTATLTVTVRSPALLQ